MSHFSSSRSWYYPCKHKNTPWDKPLIHTNRCPQGQYHRDHTNRNTRNDRRSNAYKNNEDSLLVR